MRACFSFHHLGLGFFWAWCYCLWFVPHVSTSTTLSPASENDLWLLTMFFAAILHFAVPGVLGQTRRLSQYTWPYWVAPGVMAASSALLEVSIPAGWHAVALFCTMPLGLSSALLWNIWGEFYACAPNDITLTIAPTFAVTLAGSLLVSSLLPTLFANVFICLIPILSGVGLMQARRLGYEQSPPLLLPKPVQRVGWSTILKVCIVSSIACAIATFLWALLFLLGFEITDTIMAVGSASGAVFMLLVYGAIRLFPQKLSIVNLYPWVFVLAAVALASFIMGPNAWSLAYILSMGVSVVIDVFLVIYFGTFTNKGYTRPSISFGYSEGFVCIGMVVGVLLARWAAGMGSQGILVVSLLAVIVLMVLLVVLLKQELGIVNIMAVRREDSDTGQICASIAAEFGLSSREQEVLQMLAGGYSAQGIAERLVISPYTVQTHIKHIYAKMGIHKKAELLSYIDRQRIG